MDDLTREFNALRGEATRLAGGLRDLAQRATVYHHLYQASGGNHAFPLIAAHGALWAGGYFRFGTRLGALLSWQQGPNRTRREYCMRQLEQFADAFRDINRRVCVETYTNFHFTAKYGNDARAAEFLSPALLTAHQKLHAARRADRRLTDGEQRQVFLAHFLDEQARIVGPAIDQAVAALDWALLKHIALKPLVRFAYFPAGRWLWFSNFAAREQRIANGLAAFDHAASVGWQTTEAALQSYGVLPTAFFTDTAAYFANIRRGLLAAA